MNDATRALFTEAVNAYQKKEFPTCRVKALGAFAAKKHPQIASLLGICEVELALFRDAAEHLAFAIEAGEDKHPDRGKDVTEAFAKAKAKVGTVKVTANVEGADIKKDGTVIGKVPAALYVEPGKVDLEITKDGYEPTKMSLNVLPGAEEPISVELTPSKTGPIGPDPKPKGEKPIWPYIVLGGVAAAGVGAGIGLVVTGVGKTSDFEETSCPGDESTCPAEVQDAVDDRNLFVGISAGMFALGGAALAGVIGYAIWPGPDAEAEEAWLIPTVGPDQVGVTFGKRF